MRVVGTLVDLQLVEHPAAELVLGKHASDRFPQNIFGPALQAFFGRFALLPGVAGVSRVALLRPLIAGKNDFFAIRHDDKVPRIDMRSVRRLVLAHQNYGNIASQSADDLVGGVDMPPFGFDLSRFRYKTLCIRQGRSLPNQSSVLSASQLRPFRDLCIATRASNSVKTSRFRS